MPIVSSAELLKLLTTIETFTPAMMESAELERELKVLSFAHPEQWTEKTRMTNDASKQLSLSLSRLIAIKAVNQIDEQGREDSDAASLVRL